jgi:GT2 family glycosyltransferase
MKLSVVIPTYDDRQEADRMADAVRQSLCSPLEMEFLLMDLRRDPNLPAAKNQSAIAAAGEFVMFLFPGIFPARGSIETLLERLEQDSTLTAVAGRWRNAKGKLEIGYNVRRFPTLAALILDILLLNKLFPRNRATRSYKMHDFDHKTPIRVEHANDCVLMLRRQAILRHPFNERYVPGWFDQLEFCQSLYRAGEQILYEPRAEFISNEKVPLIDRLVEQHYADYRRSEYLYIRNHFGDFAGNLARGSIAVGMLLRIGFSIVLPNTARKWFLSKLRSYVDDDYVRGLRRSYWTVFKKSLWGEM